MKFFRKIKRFFRVLFFSESMLERTSPYEDLPKVEDMVYDQKTPDNIKDLFKDKLDWDFISHVDDRILLPYRDLGYNINLWVYVARYEDGQADESGSFIHQLFDKQHIYCSTSEQYGTFTKVDNLKYMNEYYEKNGWFYSLSINTDDENIAYEDLKKIIKDVFIKIKKKYKIRIVCSNKLLIKKDELWTYSATAGYRFKLLGDV